MIWRAPGTLLLTLTLFLVLIWLVTLPVLVPHFSFHPTPTLELRFNLHRNISTKRPGLLSAGAIAYPTLAVGTQHLGLAARRHLQPSLLHLETPTTPVPSITIEPTARSRPSALQTLIRRASLLAPHLYHQSATIPNCNLLMPLACSVNLQVNIPSVLHRIHRAT